MIKIIESPQRADHKISYQTNGDILTITINEITEEFDFTYLPEGKAEEVIPDLLSINPIVSAERIGEELTVTILRFYSFEEKHLFETGEPVDMPFGGGLLGN